MNDYTRQIYNKVQVQLEVKGLQASIKCKIVDDKAKYKGKKIELYLNQQKKELTQ